MFFKLDFNLCDCVHYTERVLTNKKCVIIITLFKN